jgi:hypothetical protein
MSLPAPTLLQSALIDPHTVTRCSPAQWDLLVRQARRANLLGRLGTTLHDAGLMGAVPEAPRQHLHAADVICRRQSVSIAWEVQCIRRALARCDAPVVLLKGAAYEIAGLPAARGRLFSDVDILVPKALLPAVESALLLEGWQASEHDDYDQHYYREWMHEIPPLRHVRRDTTIDVHHNILPATARVRVNAQALIDAAIAVPGHDGVFMLQPVDMLLHSATHLFHEGEFANGLRDLFDIDALLRDFGADTCFWDALIARAAALGLGRSLYHALQTSSQILGTPVPAHALAAAQAWRPAGPAAAWMSWCYRHALQPAHPSAETRSVKAARLALYLRSHWLRMPFPLMVYHLGRKALLRPRKTGDAAATPRAEGERAP